MQKEINIQEVWNVEQEILDVIHNVCVENNLKYSLAYGTMIGAVRHGGFIPWDDDIDLIMPRVDYEKLLSIWDKVAPKGYILQNGRTDNDFTQNFTKIRKDKTTFLQSESEKNMNYHKGIFVDIFPGDRVPLKKIPRTLQYIACAVNLLYSRGFKSGSHGIKGVIEQILLSVPKKKYVKFRKKAESYIRKWEKNQEFPYVFASTIEDSKVHYPADLFDEMTSIQFNGKEYMVVDKVEQVLQIQYGDYMKLPPVEERVWKHHPLMIDFENNYEDIVKKVGTYNE